MSSVPRFFVPPEVVACELATLPPDAGHHARSVLRLRPGEPVVLHDGLGMAYTAVLEDVSAQAVTARITARQPVTTEPRTRITIAQALPKTPDKIEQVLQHGTEVGAAGFLFFAAKRSVARLDASEKLENRLARWRGIIHGAAEQSGRGVLPKVAWAGSSRDLTAHFAAYKRAFVLHEAAMLSLATVLHSLPSDAADLLVVVGPEGGLDTEEVAQFEHAGGVPINLGPRILRTETAALVALSQILFAREETSPVADASL